MPEGNPLAPTTLQDERVALEPLTLDHVPALERAAANGELWNLRVTRVPAPGAMRGYVEKALAMQSAGTALVFAVRDKNDGVIVGSTRYYDFDADVPRTLIGYTWYAKSRQRTRVNTSCKLLLLAHAFDRLGCASVSWETDILNITSQRAIERLGAGRDGVLRAHMRRADGSLRDTVVYSIIAAEWPDVRRLLELKLER